MTGPSPAVAVPVSLLGVGGIATFYGITAPEPLPLLVGAGAGLLLVSLLILLLLAIAAVGRPTGGERR